MLAVHQAVIDEVYNANVIAPCSRSLFEGRKWLTASYTPGAVDPPDDPTVVHTLLVDVTHPPTWGHITGYAEELAQRPTGLYLAPGEIASVTVPAEMVGTGFKVMVGAQNVDYGDLWEITGDRAGERKATILRMDRVSAYFDLVNTTTLVSNPLGGGLYIMVPYLGVSDWSGDNGMAIAYISGGVVQAPIFWRTAAKTTTDEEWQLLKTAPGPWADLATDKFLLNLPRSWIFDYDGDPAQLLEDYDRAMDGVAEMYGYPPILREKAGVHTLYLQPDVSLKHGAYGVGYPQVNVEWSPTQDYNGNENHWFIRDPMHSYICWHEVAHVQQRQDYTFQFEGETEAVVNYLFAYIGHVKFGLPFNDVFRKSLGTDYKFAGYEPDDAAVFWMVTPNFRDGNEMEKCDCPENEMRYQHRGYAKYADITRLFGWEAYTGTGFLENKEFDQGYANGRTGDSLDINVDEEGDPDDKRTLRFSVVANTDLTPLLYFWGVHPADPARLQESMDDYGLERSDKVFCLLDRYLGLIPRDKAEFNIHFEKIYPGRPPNGEHEDPAFGLGWYNEWRDVYNETYAAAAVERLEDIITYYYGADYSSSVLCDGVDTGGPNVDVPRPTRYAWLDSWYADGGSPTTPPSPKPPPPPPSPPPSPPSSPPSSPPPSPPSLPPPLPPPSAPPARLKKLVTTGLVAAIAVLAAGRLSTPPPSPPGFSHSTAPAAPPLA